MRRVTTLNKGVHVSIKGEYILWIPRPESQTHAVASRPSAPTVIATELGRREKILQGAEDVLSSGEVFGGHPYHLYQGVKSCYLIFRCTTRPLLPLV